MACVQYALPHGGVTLLTSLKSHFRGFQARSKAQHRQDDRQQENDMQVPI